MSASGRLVGALALLTLLLGRPVLAEGSRPGESPQVQQSESQTGPTDPEARIRQLEAKVRELAAALRALKDSSRPAETSRLEVLEKQIEALTREIERLKLGEAASSTAGESKHGFGPAASKVYQRRQGVSLGGYGELVYRNFATKKDDGDASTQTDNLDLLRGVLYFGYKWNDRILLNSEIEFEHATTGEGDEKKGEVSLEFAYLDFLLKEGFNVRAGLVLVPVGLVNELHEPPVFYGVLRPEVEQFILPTTWRENGVGIFGDLGEFSYRVYLMAGLDATGFTAESVLRDGRQSGSESKAESLALVGRLDLSGVPGLLAGASLYSGDSGQHQVVDLPSAVSVALSAHHVTLWDTHAQFQWRGIELRGLLASGSIQDVARINAALQIPPGSKASLGEKFGGWYLQAGWDLLSLGRKKSQSLSPFVRYERLDTQDRVPAAFREDPALDRTLVTVGLSWKPIPQVVVKADFQDENNRARTGVDRFDVGLGWLF